MGRKRPLRGVPNKVILEWWRRKHDRARELDWAESEPHQVSKPDSGRTIMETVLLVVAVTLWGAAFSFVLWYVMSYV